MNESVMSKLKQFFYYFIYSFLSIFLLSILIIFLMVLLFQNSSDAKPIPNSEYYTAAVVEYVPGNLSSVRDTVSINLHRYVEIIRVCKEHTIDIVVFPECGLTGCYYVDRNFIVANVAVTVPSPDLGIVPCHDQIEYYSEILSEISCAAQQGRVYVVVNLLEKVICFDTVDDTCSLNKNNETLLFNTNVVFDRNGKLIARYRKFNLYDERIRLGVNSTAEPELCTFQTDFGITFGMIICFDILFKQPSYDLIYKKNITDMIFSGAVFSQLPFLVLTSLGAGWSYAFDTTLLLSDMPVHTGSIGGSGIYLGRSGHLNVLMREHRDTKVLVTKVPKNTVIRENYSHYITKRNTCSNFNNSFFLNDSTLDYYKNQSYIQNRTSISDTIRESTFSYSNNAFNCSIKFIWRSNKDLNNLPEYKLLAFSGKRNFSVASFENYIEACGIMLCTKNENGTCTEPPNFDDSSKLTVLSINIFAISEVTTTTVIPSTLDNCLYPLNVSYFTFSSSTRKLNRRYYNIVNMNLVKPTSNLVIFGIYKLPEKLNPNSNLHYYTNDD